MAPNSSSFEQLWLPRIGPEGVKLARRSAILTVAMMFGTPILAICFGLLISRAPAVGVMFLVADILLLVAWLQSRRQLAAGISRHLGVKIQWPGNMPSLRTTAGFDSWVASNATPGLSPT
jgi:hypothetical protein